MALDTVASNSCLILCILFFNHLPSSIKLSRRQFSIVACKSWVLRHHHHNSRSWSTLTVMRPELIKNCRNRVGSTCTWCWVLKKNRVDSLIDKRSSVQECRHFLVLHKLLLVPFCFVVLELFNVFSIFCMTTFGDRTRPQHHKKSPKTEN